MREGDSRPLGEAHIHYRYRSSTRKLAIISSSFVHNNHSLMGNCSFHQNQPVIDTISKPREDRRKFVRASDKIGKVTHPILFNRGYVIWASLDLTMVPLGCTRAGPLRYTLVLRLRVRRAGCPP